MGSLYDLYKDPEPWDQNLPTDLMPPIKHLRKTFDLNHFTYGQVTQKLCFWQLHPGTPDDEINEYLKPLQQLKSIAGAPATQRFIELLELKTEPATFKAFFDLYLDGISVPALATFYQLIAVGKANEQRLDRPHIEWAEAQTKNMVRYHVHVIRIWVQNVCDRQPYTPDDMDEQIYWRKWEAPMLLVMKPSRYMPYDPAKVWDRNDPETSSGWLDSFAERYVLHVEAKLEKLAGETALELAKTPRQPPAPAPAVSPKPSHEVAAAPSKLKRTPRESHKLATQAKYRSWQKEYKSLKLAHPDKSDVWLAQKISRMAIAGGSSWDTIRKHMKRN